MANVGKTDRVIVDPTINEIVSSLILDNFDEYNVLMQLVNDMSGSVTKGMKSISFPCVEPFDGQKQTFPLTAGGATLDGTVDPDGNPIVCQTLNITTEKLEIDCKAVTGFKYDPCDLYQSVLNVESELMKVARNSLIRTMETHIIGEIDLVDAANVLPATNPGEIIEGDLICLQTLLDAKGIPASDRCYLLNPLDAKFIYQMKCLKDASQSGDATSIFRTAVIGQIMGNNVVTSRLVPQGNVYLFHKDHVRFARQGELSYLETDVPKAGCKEASMTLKFGSLAVKGGCRGAKLTL